MVLKRIKNSEAVSPVVGVMLMLVVTIIIAAVVSGFAGGLTENTKVAPQASIDVEINPSASGGMGGTVFQMTFKHLSGDSIPTKDIQIITYFTNTSGYIYKHTQTGANNATILYPESSYDSSLGDARIPYLGDMEGGYAHSHPEIKDFGNFTFSTGDIMTTYNLRGTAELLGMTWTEANNQADYATLDDKSLKSGSVVDVKILHKPSGKYIFDKEVIVL